MFRSTESVDYSILYDRDGVVVVDKPPGIPTHTTADYPLGITEIVSGMLDRRFHPVHRLDMYTSGLVILGDKTVRHTLAESFEERTVMKGYFAIVCGKAEKDYWVSSSEIKGRPAQTNFKALVELESSEGESYTLVEAYPVTGRTHQIRIHLADSGYPIAGDPIYNKRPGSAPRHLLHAFKLGFTSPKTGELLSFEAPLPKDFVEFAGKMTATIRPLTLPTAA
jgi:RluA family pseudouridine synthase